MNLILTHVWLYFSEEKTFKGDKKIEMISFRPIGLYENNNTDLLKENRRFQRIQYVSSARQAHVIIVIYNTEENGSRALGKWQIVKATSSRNEATKILNEIFNQSYGEKAVWNMPNNRFINAYIFSSRIK